MAEEDPLRSALHEATLAVLLGSTKVHLSNVDAQGMVSSYLVSIPSAFGERIRAKAFSGEFDAIIQQAMTKVSVDNVAKAIEGILAEQFLEGLKKERNTWSGDSQGWLQSKSKDIAVEACKQALSGDEELLDILRTKIGAEVDRNKVGITVNLTDPEN